MIRRSSFLMFIVAFFVLALSANSFAIVTYTYDRLYRVTKIGYDNGTIEEYSYDAVGNRQKLVVTIDTIPPNSPVVTGITPTNDATPTWFWITGGCGGNGAFRYKLDSNDFSSGASEATANSYTPATDLPDSAHTLYVQERDAAGNWSSFGNKTIVIDTTPPLVTITATDPTATEAGTTTGQFTVSRTGGTASSLTVKYAASGTATSGSDYKALSGSVTIPAGSPTATITVTPINDTVVEDPETVIATLSADAAYTIGTPSSATVTITSITVNVATVYEDAEDGSIAGWTIYDNDPAGATISNVYDSIRQSRVIKFAGKGTSNGYRLQNVDGSPWHNSSQFMIEWSMNFAEDFVIYINVQTTAGQRYLTYQPVDNNTLGTDQYVYLGLGSQAKNGRWQTIVRDLQSDLDMAQPGVKITEVNGFLVRGSGLIDDIKLFESSPKTVYEDAEDGSIAGWTIYDNDPAGATISNVYDSIRQSRVIKFAGIGTSNGYRLQGVDGSPWHNSSQFMIEWSMNFAENFVIYINVQTTAGQRYLTYQPVDNNTLGTGQYVYLGLGSQAKNGRWQTIVCDLQSNLNMAQPGVKITEVNGFLIRGSGLIDDIKLFESSPKTVYEYAEDGSIAGWTIYDNDPAGATISNVYDSIRQSRVIKFAGKGTSNGYRLQGVDGSPWHNSSQFMIEWSMNFAENFVTYINVQPTAGQRYLTYQPVDNNTLGTGQYVYLGLGSQAKNGKWQTIIRDLQSDLDMAQPGVKITEVNGFLARGSGLIDDIKLFESDPKTVYEDAEDGSIAGWTIYDNDPAGATISNVYDSISQSRVIKFAGKGTSNGYRLQGVDGSPWKNSSQFVIKWSMNFAESFVTYINVQTTVGQRYLTYQPVDNNTLGTGQYIYFGIGSNTKSGNWQTVVRDLQTDLEKALPGEKIIQVNSLLIRGSGQVDDINLR